MTVDERIDFKMAVQEYLESKNKADAARERCSKATVALNAKVRNLRDPVLVQIGCDNYLVAFNFRCSTFDIQKIEIL